MASRASASPRGSIVKTESGIAGQGQVASQQQQLQQQAHGSSSLTPGNANHGQASPGYKAEGHAANMEGASGVPERIEEAIEPD